MQSWHVQNFFNVLFMHLRNSREEFKRLCNFFSSSCNKNNKAGTSHGMCIEFQMILFFSKHLHSITLCGEKAYMSSAEDVLHLHPSILCPLLSSLFPINQLAISVDVDPDGQYFYPSKQHLKMYWKQEDSISSELSSFFRVIDCHVDETEGFLVEGSLEGREASGSMTWKTNWRRKRSEGCKWLSFFRRTVLESTRHYFVCMQQEYLKTCCYIYRVTSPNLFSCLEKNKEV